MATGEYPNEDVAVVATLTLSLSKRTTMILVKTPCASAVLRYFNVTGTTWNERTKKNVWPDTLRRNGFAVRSRLSNLRKKESTVGAARNRLAAIAFNEPKIIAFVVRVKGHVLVVGRDGKTIVDTSPRKRDARKIRGLFAIWAN